MQSTELHVELPESLTEDEAKLWLAAKLFEVGRASLSQAAKIAGLSKRTFMELLGREKIPIVRYSAEDLLSEVGL